MKDISTFLSRRNRCALTLPLLVLWTLPAMASVFGNVRGIVHDPQHRPIQHAHITLKAQTSDWSPVAGLQRQRRIRIPLGPHRKLHGHRRVAGFPADAARRHRPV